MRRTILIQGKIAYKNTPRIYIWLIWMKYNIVFLYNNNIVNSLKNKPAFMNLWPIIWSFIFQCIIYNWCHCNVTLFFYSKLILNIDMMHTPFIICLTVSCQVSIWNKKEMIVSYDYGEFSLIRKKERSFHGRSIPIRKKLWTRSHELYHL